ncbi:Glycine betaine transport ATP-binding protein OpuAA [compost metagenome]
MFITHDLDEAVRIGNRIAILKDGKLIQVGTPQDILNNPADEYVNRFVQRRLALDENVQKPRPMRVAHA